MRRAQPCVRSRQLLAGISCALFFVAVLCIVPVHAEAQAKEVRVVDFQGLVRAVRPVQGTATVFITVRRIGATAPTGEVPVLNQRNGIAPDIEAVFGAAGEYVFRDVAPGLWRIRLRDPGFGLISVRIEDKQ